MIRTTKLVKEMKGHLSDTILSHLDRNLKQLYPPCFPMETTIKEVESNTIEIRIPTDQGPIFLTIKVAERY